MIFLIKIVNHIIQQLIFFIYHCDCHLIWSVYNFKQVFALLEEFWYGARVEFLVPLVVVRSRVVVLVAQCQHSQTSQCISVQVERGLYDDTYNKGVTIILAISLHIYS